VPGPSLGGYATRALIPEIERTYLENNVNVSRLSVEQKLESFAGAVAFSFGVASTATSASDLDVPQDDVTVSIAGLDTDGSIKVGQVRLVRKPIDTGMRGRGARGDDAMTARVQKYLSQHFGP
jgi:hypothetical protein